MEISPLITKHIYTKHTSFVIDIQLQNNITFIGGESETGRSLLYSIIEELAAEDKRIKCFNYLDYKMSYKSSIKRSKGKLFVIDNADILLDDCIRSFIALDNNNQYIIIGRNPTGFLLNMDEIYELKSETINEVTTLLLPQLNLAKRCR